MANKFLNLDEYVPDEKIITLGGVKHSMREITVEEYIAKVKAARDVVEADLTVDQQVEKTIEMIVEAFPTMTPALLKPLTLSQLTLILDFIMAKPEEIERQVTAAQGNA